MSQSENSFKSENNLYKTVLSLIFFELFEKVVKVILPYNGKIT